MSSLFLSLTGLSISEFISKSKQEEEKRAPILLGSPPFVSFLRISPLHSAAARRLQGQILIFGQIVNHIFRIQMVPGFTHPFHQVELQLLDHIGVLWPFDAVAHLIGVLRQVIELVVSTGVEDVLVLFCADAANRVEAHVGTVELRDDIGLSLCFWPRHSGRKL